MLNLIYIGILWLAFIVTLVIYLLDKKQFESLFFDYKLHRAHIEMLYYTSLMEEVHNERQRFFDVGFIMFEENPDILYDHEKYDKYEKVDYLIKDIKSKIREYEEEHGLEPFIINNVELRKTVEYIHDYLKRDEEKEQGKKLNS